MAFPLRVIDAVRAAWPEDKPLSVRISATDWAEGGLAGDEPAQIAAMLKAHGVDIVDVSTGETSATAMPVYGRLYQTPFADEIRNEAGVPTIAVGNITEPDQINSILVAGRADLVALGRPHLHDPVWTLRAAASAGHKDVFVPAPYAMGQAQALRLAQRPTT